MNLQKSQTFAPANIAKGNLTGFTLVELLVAISIIGFIAVTTMVVINVARKSARDTVRVANIATIKRALAMYLNDSTSGYPASTGECLSAGSGVGSGLISFKVLLSVPADPLWPTAVPSNIGTGANLGVAISPSNNFCYYYFSNFPSDSGQYRISFFLESNSKVGTAGINFTTQ